ncbi:MAG: restriction endonuclease [Cytophagales bacterium]|nr:restriction endonuclease [Cytophagales bacterium]
MEFPNRLYFGDCLNVLKELHREHPNGFIDLIYIDPPFNSKRNYNVLFESIDLDDTNAQKQAFADTWSNYEYVDTINELAELDRDLHTFLKTLSDIRISDSAVAYLSTMAIRIYYMHKVLKDTGSFYLHCDPNMSHYLKVVCDLVFGFDHFKNEIIWKRSVGKGDVRRKYGSNHDIILFYTKSSDYKFKSLFLEKTEDYKARFKLRDEKGYYRLAPLDSPNPRPNLTYTYKGYQPPKNGWRVNLEQMKKYDQEGVLHFPKDLAGRISKKHYLNDQEGVKVDTVWNDITPLQSSEKEKLGYPTQKPEALLDRIIEASSNEGDLVADFFCGCGTTVSVAQRLNRRWIGTDISHLAVRLIKKRLTEAYGYKAMEETIVHGFPEDIASARMLAEETVGGRYSFQDWVIEVLLGGVVNPKKSGDGGYDGYLTFELPDKKEFILIETKSGKVDVKKLREFIHVVNKQKAAIGIYVCFGDSITKEMVKEAKSCGYYDEATWGQNFPRIQLSSVEDLLQHNLPKYPVSRKGTFKTAERVDKKGNQKGLFDS